MIMTLTKTLTKASGSTLSSQLYCAMDFCWNKRTVVRLSSEQKKGQMDRRLQFQEPLNCLTIMI